MNRVNHNLSRKMTVIAFLLLFCAIYMPYLSRTIQYDEAFTYIEYASSPLRALFVYTAPNNHLLHSFLVWLSTSLMGDSLIAIRFPAFMAALLSVAYIYRLGRKLATHNAGLLALVLLAGIPMFAGFIPNARGYSLCVLLSLIYFDFLFFGPRDPNRRQQYTLMLVVALLIMTLPTMVLLIGALMAWVLVRFMVIDERRSLPVAYIMPTFIGGIIGTPFYMYGFISGGVGGYSSRFGATSIGTLLEGFINQSAPGSSVVVFLAIVLIAIGGTWLKQRRYLLAFALIVGVALVLAIIQDIVMGSTLFPRNYVYLTPFIALLVAVGWTAILEGFTQNRLVLLLPALLLLIYVAYDARSLGEQTRVDQFQAAIEAHATEGDTLLVSCCLDYPVKYINHGSDLFRFDDATERVIVIPTPYFPFESLISVLTEPVECAPDTWDDFEIYVCPINIAEAG